MAYLEQGHTINGAYYDMPGNCKKEVRKTDLRCSALAGQHSPAHTSQVAMTAATECGFEIFPYPPYLPDVAPSDFYLFPKLKSHLCGTQRHHRSSKLVLGDQEKTFYFEGVRKLEQRWAKYIALRGDYIEK